MDVAALRSKVTFQKNETVTDRYGNHKNAWTDYYTCFATIGGEGLASSKEEEVAGTTVEDFSMTVSIRSNNQRDHSHRPSAGYPCTASRLPL